jgi:predicted transcriptional regulator
LRRPATGDCDDGVYRAIATKLIALAKAGERSPDMLCEQALTDILGREPVAALNEAEVSR